MFSTSPFSTSSLSSLRVIRASAVLEALAVLTAQAVRPAVSLIAIASVLADPTVRSSDAQIFEWTVPARSATWNFSEKYSGEKLIWSIPTGVGASTWTLPN